MRFDLQAEEATAGMDGAAARNPEQRVRKRKGDRPINVTLPPGIWPVRNAGVLMRRFVESGVLDIIQVLM